MLKYGELLKLNNGNSKSLIPRNLTFTSNYSQNNGIITTILKNDSTINIDANYNSAIISTLETSIISLIPNSILTNITINSPIAFSLFKSDYELNNFNIYPIYISQNMMINNNNFILNTENFTIKDNVIIINSQNTNTIINQNTTDIIISGIIFPISDKNTSTGYYSGLLYVPNNKLEQINNSLFFKWNNNQYNYFTNINKGFYKLKYLSQELTFMQYQNKMDSNYQDLVNNNNNLANLQVNAIGLYDGEIVSMNNTNISLNLSDGNIIFKTINITNKNIQILNNLNLTFINSFLIQDSKENNYLSFNNTNELITYYKNILFNSQNATIFFEDVINYNSKSTNILKITGSENKLEIFSKTYINSLTLNNNSSIKFISSLSFKDQDSNIYITFDNNKIITRLPLNIDILSINTSLNLLNNIPITVVNNLTIKNLNNIYAIFNLDGFNIYNNIIFNTINNPKILYNPNQIFTITDQNNTIQLNISDTVTINGPNNNFSDLSNCIVNSSFTVTNTSVGDYNLTYYPQTKLYILSGITQINGIFTFTCNNIINLNNMSGKIIGTTWAQNTSYVNAYDINIWSYSYINNNGEQNYNIGYNSLEQINKSNNGDWYIKNIYLVQSDIDNKYNLNIDCIGSIYDKIIWGFKVDVLQI